MDGLYDAEREDHIGRSERLAIVENRFVVELEGVAELVGRGFPARGEVGFGLPAVIALRNVFK
jgi:hypothetical protein